MKQSGILLYYPQQLIFDKCSSMLLCLECLDETSHISSINPANGQLSLSPFTLYHE